MAGGCSDDRKRVAADIFLCNASSHTADYDCGDGYLCYSAMQALGESMCVPSCDPDHPAKTCPGGVCTQGHECLTACRVEDAHPCPSGGGLLSCMRTTYSPIEAQSGNDGVCVPVAFSCRETSDCGSPLYNLCTSETNGQKDNDQLPKSGSVCAQGNCASDGVACQPGSTCIRKVLPAAVTDAPDVCTPNCQKRTLPGDGGTVEECPPGFGCLDQAFPQTQSLVCSPGFPGWICKDPLACVAGSCSPWSDVGGPFQDFTTCAPPCAGDDDCLVYDRPGNANVLSHFTCVEGQCRHLQSLFFTGLCLHHNDKCSLDPDARCGVAPEPPDGGVAYDGCNLLPTSAMPLAATGGASALCSRSCSSNNECATLTANSHVTWACVGGGCVPAVPFVFPCDGDGDCMPGLSCLAAPPAGPPYKVCTRSCATGADCAATPALGSNFACAGGVCVPKLESGCPAPARELCLSGVRDDSDGRCKSPKGWTCDNDDQHPQLPVRCLSGQCSDGHCQ